MYSGATHAAPHRTTACPEQADVHIGTDIGGSDDPGARELVMEGLGELVMNPASDGRK